jgi:UDP:flavonoid glycosyltransferase YjiC (YdhE family)
MAKILFATVPLSGHVNPGIPIARALAARGHEVAWYTGSHFAGRIRRMGIRHFPFRKATDFADHRITEVFGIPPNSSLLKHVGFYQRRIFYGPMKAYYEDLQEILKEFDADLIVSDEWFTGSMPFSELGLKPVVIYGNSPLMMLSGEGPAPGSGTLPAKGPFGRNRDRIVKSITRGIFRNLHKDINQIRSQCGLPPLTYFFTEQNLHVATMTLKFNTEIFEFPFDHLPPGIRFVGPILPEASEEAALNWIEELRSSGRPTVFITQGSVDVYNINKLIIPSIRALQYEKLNLIISTGGNDPETIRRQFADRQLYIEKFIPYSSIIPLVDLIITNGGYGGVSTALSHGKPVIIAGSSEDKPEIASRLRYTGAGIDLKTGSPSASRIHKAVHAVMHQSSYKENAERIMRDFNQHNAVNESISLIEDLLREQQKEEK